MSPKGTQDQTARTLKFARNWYRDGMLADRMLQLENPASGEFTDIRERIPYLSLLPGPVVAAYAVSLMQNHEPDIQTVQIANLASQYVTALMLALCAWLLLADKSPSLRMASALLAGGGYIVLPFLLYIHQQIYYSDMGAMPFYSAFMACWVLYRRAPDMPKALLMAAILGGALMMEWFAFLLIGAFAIACLLDRAAALTVRLMRYLPTVIVTTACIGLMLYQFHITGLGESFYNRFYDRLPIRTDMQDVLNVLRFRVFEHISLEAYGFTGRAIIIAMTLYSLCYPLVLLARRPPLAARLRMEIIIIACWFPLLYLIINPTHYTYHDFSLMRFAPVMLLCGFLLFAHTLQDMRLQVGKWMPWLCVACGYAYLAWMLSLQGPLHWFTKHPYIPYDIPRHIAAHTRFDDLVFSPNYTNEVKWPAQDLAISMKRVYRIADLEEMNHYVLDDFAHGYARIYRVKNGPRVTLPTDRLNNMLFIVKAHPCWPLSPDMFRYLQQHARVVKQTDRSILYRLSHAPFPQLPLCQR